MKFILILISALFNATATYGVTITESIARLGEPATYKYDLGFSRVGTTLYISTFDNWKTASFLFVNRSHPKAHNSEYDVGIFAPIIRSHGLLAAEILGEQIYTRPRIGGSRFGFLVGHQGQYAGPDLWDTFSTKGIGVRQYFFGNEYLNASRIVLTDRSITSYKLKLGEAALVPLPASGWSFAAVLAFVFARFGRRRVIA